MDDFSFFDTNQTLSQVERLDLAGLDELVCMVAAAHKVASGQCEELVAVDGTRVPVKLNDFWKLNKLQS